MKEEKANEDAKPQNPAKKKQRARISQEKTEVKNTDTPQAETSQIETSHVEEKAENSRPKNQNQQQKLNQHPCCKRRKKH